ncbi:hypothetical protein PUR61_05260 [Streptomyces sp. BE20]|uniref:hypothetical protein n=1 Tax=Streptomyces sp. BE20 TaxID=3002525 RepID=UPI002E7755DE|nr:hypothetical protein [Streptomyces sp. BE20]MEE1821606.1 hypothetical protein [Streptomyces sp. BE20]
MIVMDERILARLKGMAEEGTLPSEVTKWLLGEISANFTDFLFMQYFFRAFEVPLVDVRDLEEWVGLERGGSLSDFDIDNLFGPLKARP